MLVLRSDMTIPIARVVATRYAGVEPPLRLCYLQRAYRSVRPQRGEAREQLQAGIELVGVPTAGRDRRGDRPLLPGARRRRADALLDRARLAALYPALLAEAGIDGEARDRLLHELVTRDFVGLAREVRRWAPTPAAADPAAARRPRGARRGRRRSADGLREVHELLPPE